MSSTLPGEAEEVRITRDGEDRKLRCENDPESYPHSTPWARIRLKGRIWNSTGSAMAYVRFDQILYSANCTAGPWDRKIKRRK
jgi:hypothetical protein